MSDGMSQSRHDAERIAKFTKLGYAIRKLVKEETDPMFGLNEAFVDALNDELRFCKLEIRKVRR